MKYLLFFLSCCVLNAQTITNHLSNYKTTAVGVYRTETNLITIEVTGTNIVKIDMSGKVTLAAGISSDDASKRFWSAITTNYPPTRKLIAESYYGVSKEELLATVRDINRYFLPGGDPSQFHAVYISPANRLRKEADEIETKEALIVRFKALMQKLELAK